MVQNSPLPLFPAKVPWGQRTARLQSFRLIGETTAVHHHLFEGPVPSGKHTKSYGKIMENHHFIVGKINYISMAMFNSYVKLPEGI